MRLVVALGLLLIGVQSASPETASQEIPQEKMQENVQENVQENMQDTVQQPDQEVVHAPSRGPIYESTSSADGVYSFPPLRSANGNSDRAVVLAAPSGDPVGGSLESAHDQGESDKAEGAQTLALAATEAEDEDDAETDADASYSVSELCDAVLTSAQEYDLPVSFFSNLIWQESRFRHDAVSRVGALGIAQFMPSVAVEAGVADPFDPRQAIPASARFLSALRHHFGNLGYAAAAYNAGARRVGQWLDRRRALPFETRTYVLRVTGRTAEAWRKSTIDDSRLTFTQQLPCRGLPTFAELEQAQIENGDAPKDNEKLPLAAVAVKSARNAKTSRLRKIVHDAGKTSAAATHSAAPEPRKATNPAAPAPALIAGLAAGTAKVAAGAKAAHAAKREAVRPQHGAHEKRRVADAT
jgi:hypothetical protein